MDAILEVLRAVVLLPFVTLWSKGWPARVLAVCYLTLPPAVAVCLLAAMPLLPPPVTWVAVTVLALWAASLVPLLFEAIGDGCRWLWRRLRHRVSADD